MSVPGWQQRMQQKQSEAVAFLSQSSGRVHAHLSEHMEKRARKVKTSAILVVIPVVALGNKVSQTDAAHTR